MPSAGFEHAIPATSSKQTYVLDSSAIGIGLNENTSAYTTRRLSQCTFKRC